MESLFAPRSPLTADTRRPDYQDLKSRVHEALLDRLDLDRLAYVKREEAEPEIRRLIIAMLDRETENFVRSRMESRQVSGLLRAAAPGAAYDVSEPGIS